jgi:arylsulfatase A-like enzyme
MGRSAYLVDHFRMPLWDWDPDAQYTRDQAYLLTNKDGETVRRPLTEDDVRGPTGTEADGPHTSEIFAEAAVQFIDSYSEEKPYFLYLAFHAPHDPRQAPASYRAMYPPEKIELPPSYLPQHPFDNGHMFLRDEQLAPWPRTLAVAQQQLADYYAIITHLDDQIGKVIQALKAKGEYDNTIIVLAGDSGLAVGNHGLMGKQNIYDEDGVHIPLVFSGMPLGVKGSRLSALAYNFDIFPTLCQALGIQAPASVMGKSLLPVLRRKVDAVRDHTYHAYSQFQRAYRKGDYKLIEYVRSPDAKRDGKEFVAGSRVTQLFNVKTDPWEVYDLSFIPEYADRLGIMRKEMRSKAVEIGDYKENVAGERYDFWDAYKSFR